MLLLWCNSLVYASNIFSSIDLPQTGVFRAALENGDRFAAKILHKKRDSICQSLSINNIPENAILKGPIVFHLETKMSSEKYGVYFNGYEYLSHIDSGEGHGTWIIGYEPGKDSGFGYIRAQFDSFSPIGHENGTEWNWIQGRDWIPDSSTLIQCFESYPAPLSYSIEYYSGNDILTSVIRVCENKNTKFCLEKSMTEGTFVLINRKWVKISQIFSSYGLGDIFEIKFQTGKKLLGFYVNDELSSSNGWRLTFRLLNPDVEISNNHSIAVNSPIHPHLAGESHSLVLQTIMDSRRDDELIVDFGKNGFHQVDVVPLSQEAMDIHDSISRRILSSALPGEFLWLWYSDQKIVTSRDQMLLQCVFKSDKLSLFRYFVSDRVITMRESILEKDTQFLTWNNGVNKLMFEDKEIELHSVLFIGDNMMDYVLSYLYHKETTLGDLPSCFLYHAAMSFPRPLVYAAEIFCVLLGAKPVSMIQYSSASDMQWKFPLVREILRGISIGTKAFPDFDVGMSKFKYFNDESLIIYRSSRRYLAYSLRPFGQAQALHPAPYPDLKTQQHDWTQQIYNSWWNGYVLGYPLRFVDSYCETFHNGLSLEDKRNAMLSARYDVENYFAILSNAAPCSSVHSEQGCSLSFERTVQNEDYYDYAIELGIASSARSESDKESNTGLALTPVSIAMGLDPPVSEDFWIFLREFLKNRL